jgi:hypothetical protein
LRSASSSRPLEAQIDGLFQRVVALGKLRQRHHKSELAESLQDAVAPGHSGLLALVSDPGAVQIRQALARADAIVESAIDKVEAADIKAAAKEAQESEKD